MDEFDTRFNADDEHDEEEKHPPGRPNDLITLLSLALDKVVVSRHMIRILEDFRRSVE